MKNTLKISIAILVLALTVLACSVPGSVPAPTKAPAQTTPGAEGKTVVTEQADLSQQLAVDDSGYPKTPEGVIKAFLTAYSLDTREMTNYLSEARLGNMPSGGTLAMLKINGALEGFVIESATVSPENSVAVVTVTIRAGGAENSRVFNLVLKDEKWKIDAIEVK